MPDWTKEFTYSLMLDTVHLRPNSENRAWKMKQRIVEARERQANAIGRIERALAKIGKNK